jgi:hypothetical protein
MFGFFKKDKTPKVATETYTDQYRKINTPTFQDRTDAPFRLKKNEEYIGSQTATICLYKNDGRVAAHGLTASIKIAPGIRYRAGAGRMAMGKSWQADQHGTLHFTTDRIIFDGDNKNFSVRWDKVIGLSHDIDGTQITIDRESGADWLFVLDSQLPLEQMATMVMVEENRI